MYLLIAVGLMGLRNSLSRWIRRPEPVAAAVLLICATVQCFDLTIPNQYDWVRSYFFSRADSYHIDRLDDPRWKLVNDGAYKHMSVLPVTLKGCNGASRAEGYNSGRVALLSLQAYRANLTFNSGYFSRQRARVGESCAMQNATAASHLDADTVYVLTNGTPESPGAACGLLNNILVCVSGDNDDALARALRG
jgi:hypothetical protein